MNLKSLGAASLLVATQSFAIVGFGAHYVLNTGSVDAAKSNVYKLSLANPNTPDAPGATTNVLLDQKKVESLSGVGVKLWIDALPFVDIEATGNMQFSRYSATLGFQDSATGSTVAGMQPVPIELEFEGVPFLGKARPVFAAMSGDLSITYPFTMLPVIRPYVGGGVSYFASTPVMNAKFTRKFLEKTGSALLDPEELAANPEVAETVGTALGEALADEGLNTGIGGHALVGVRIKPPVIPLAIYANSKYYFGGNFDSQYNPGFVFELGGGFAL